MPKDEAARALVVADEYGRQARTIATVIAELEAQAKAFDAAKVSGVGSPSEAQVKRKK